MKSHYDRARYKFGWFLHKRLWRIATWKFLQRFWVSGKWNKVCWPHGFRMASRWYDFWRKLSYKACGLTAGPDEQEEEFLDSVYSDLQERLTV